jgi:UV excision repair protein RAD23
MLIYIKNLRGDKTEIEIQESDTILSIKETLSSLQGHPPDLQKLILAGKILEDGKTASESGVVNGSILVLMVSKAKPQAKPVPVPSAPSVPQVVNSVPLPSPLVPSSETVPATVSSVPGDLEGPNALLTGDSLSSTINSIVEMGFDRKDVEAAMKAAYNNPDRAIEYLTNGIPAPRSQAPSNVNDEQFRQLMQEPLFMQLLAMVQQNPAALTPILNQLQQSNPEIYNLISANRESFMKMLQEPQVSQIDPSLIAGLPRPPRNATVINLTPEEQQSIKNLTELGFNRNDALEAYLSCDKNESLAASLLLENYQPAGIGSEFDIQSPDKDDQDNP